MTMHHAESQVERPFNAHQPVRRLAAAEGYLEMQLPLYALAELNRVGDAGPFDPIAQLFRGEALQAQEKYAEAIAPLNRAAETFPVPFNQRALMALSNCYRHEGFEHLAEETAAAADRSAAVSVATRTITPIFQIAPSANRPGVGEHN